MLEKTGIQLDLIRSGVAPVVAMQLFTLTIVNIGMLQLVVIRLLEIASGLGMMEVFIVQRIKEALGTKYAHILKWEMIFGT